MPQAGLNIALVLEHFDLATGGLANWTAQFAVHLLGRGHQVHVVTFRAALRPVGVVMHEVSETGTVFDRLRRIAACLASFQPDVVHDTGTSWCGDVFQPQTGSRLLAFRSESQGLGRRGRMRALLMPRAVWWQLCLARLERRQVRAARRIVAVSGMVAQMLARRHRLAPGAVRVIHNGIDTEAWSPAAMAPLRAAGRAALGLGPADVLFVMVAHNFWLKNLDTVLAALAHLVQTGAAARLAVAGGMPDVQWTTRVAALGLSAQVRFCGYVADMRGILAAADCAVHPTRWDACSLATLEAMACGCPVITTRANGAADAIEDSVSGYVLDHPHDARRLAARMAALLEPAHRHEMGRAARTASLRFDAAAKFIEVEAVLHEAAALRAKAPRRA